MGGQSFLSKHTIMVTLTFDDEHLGNFYTSGPKTLWKNYMNGLRKVLRKQGTKVQAFAVHELGEKKGRPHLHAVLWTSDVIPKIEYGFSCVQAYWPHGNSLYEFARSNAGAIAYVYDYLVDKGGEQLSKSNELGKEYLHRWAETQARHGANPFSDYGFHYNVAGDFKKSGSLRNYVLPASHPWISSLAERYCDAWDEYHGDRPMLSKARVLV